MERKHNRELVPVARTLRKSMTKEERKLWYEYLRAYPVKFTRQKVLGAYVADFYCAKVKLVIELDGSQHYLDGGPRRDAARTGYLNNFGVTVLRIPNNYVNSNLRGVCEYIDNAVTLMLKGETPPPIV